MPSHNGSWLQLLAMLVMGALLGTFVTSIGFFGAGVRASEQALRRIIVEPPEGICPVCEPEPTPKMCAECPWPKGETDKQARQRLCAPSPNRAEQERQAAELKLCELGGDLAQEGWRKAAANWGRCCEQCSIGTDVLGELKACDSC